MVLDVETHWECPNCPHTHVSKTALQHAVVHICPGLAGLIAPLVRAGTDCRVEAIERQDYVGREKPQVNALGRPIMSIVTTYADGSNDCRVLAPAATGGGRGGLV